MADVKRVKLMRGNEASRLSVTPAQGELISSLDELKVYLGDGNKAGGYMLNADNLIAIYADQSDSTKKHSLAWWINYFNGTNATIRVPRGTHNILSDLIIPANIHLRCDRGAVLSIGATKTLTVNCHIDAADWDVFSGDGTVVNQSSGGYPTLGLDRIYNGVNLEVKHAAEIAGYSDVWAWIKARITAVDYSGLHVGDYVPFVMNGNAIKAQIAGIDTYREYGDVAVGHHIDFVSKDCYPVNVLWNTTNVNNGSAANAAPWMVSNIKSVLNTTWYGYLPAALQAQIIEKRLHIETRYSSGSTLTDSTSWEWNDVGKLWVPSEFEVYGEIIWGTKGYSQNGSVQYPVFAGNSEKRVKNQGDGGDRCAWWLLSVDGGYSTHCCLVGYYGLASNTYASTATLCAPVCFRIG
jgi:hypothetical protein